MLESYFKNSVMLTYDYLFRHLGTLSETLYFINDSQLRKS